MNHFCKATTRPQVGVSRSPTAPLHTLSCVHTQLRPQSSGLSAGKKPENSIGQLRAQGNRVSFVGRTDSELEGSECDAIIQFEKLLGYHFRYRGHAWKALIHPSIQYFGVEDVTPLGRAVWALICTLQVAETYPKATASGMSQMSQNASIQERLVATAKSLGLGACLIFEKQPGLSEPNNKMLKNQLMASVAAVYLDGGLEKARTVFHKSISSLLSDMPTPQPKVKEVSTDVSPKTLRQILMEINKEGLTPKESSDEDNASKKSEAAASKAWANLVKVKHALVHQALLPAVQLQGSDVPLKGSDAPLIEKLDVEADRLAKAATALEEVIEAHASANPSDDIRHLSDVTGLIGRMLWSLACIDAIHAIDRDRQEKISVSEGALAFFYLFLPDEIMKSSAAKAGLARLMLGLSNDSLAAAATTQGVAVSSIEAIWGGDLGLKKCGVAEEDARSLIEQAMAAIISDNAKQRSTVFEEFHTEVHSDLDIWSPSNDCITHQTLAVVDVARKAEARSRAAGLPDHTIARFSKLFDSMLAITYLYGGAEEVGCLCSRLLYTIMH